MIRKTEIQEWLLKMSALFFGEADLKNFNPQMSENY